jgi:hypothetical protein
MAITIGIGTAGNALPLCCLCMPPIGIPITRPGGRGPGGPAPIIDIGPMPIGSLVPNCIAMPLVPNCMPGGGGPCGGGPGGGGPGA